MTTITVTGIDQLNARLDTMRRDLKAETGASPMYRAMKRSVYRVVYTLADYPRQRPTDYVRTGTLGRRWTSDIRISKTYDGLQGRAGNNTEYGPWVQSQSFQTAFHRETGWTTDRQALDRNKAAIEREFESAVRQMTRKG